MWLHAHVGFWILGLIVFVLTFILYILGKNKPARILQMFLHFLFLLILITGVVMVAKLYSADNFVWSTIKGLFGILVIGMMNAILNKTKKKENAVVFWIIFIIGLAGVFSIGYGVL